MKCNGKSLTKDGAETGSGPNARVSKTADLLVAQDVSATCSPTGFEDPAALTDAVDDLLAR